MIDSKDMPDRMRNFFLYRMSERLIRHRKGVVDNAKVVKKAVKNLTLKRALTEQDIFTIEETLMMRYSSHHGFAYQQEIDAFRKWRGLQALSGLGD
jgi:hypothetical protein